MGKQTTQNPETLVVTLGGEKRNIRIGAGAYKLAQFLHKDIPDLGSFDMSADALTDWAWIGRIPEEPDLTKEQCMRELAMWDPVANGFSENEFYEKVGERVARIMVAYKSYMTKMLEGMGVTADSVDKIIEKAIGAEGNSTGKTEA